MKYRIILSVLLLVALAFAAIVVTDSDAPEGGVLPAVPADAAPPTNFNL